MVLLIFVKTDLRLLFYNEDNFGTVNDVTLSYALELRLTVSVEPLLGKFQPQPQLLYSFLRTNSHSQMDTWDWGS
jgi:hypothetical protein